MRFFDNLVLRLTGRNLAEERRRAGLSQELDQAQSQISDGVKQILSYPLKGHTEDGSYPAWAWKRLWMSVYLIENPRSRPPIDQTVTAANGIEVMSDLFMASEAFEFLHNEGGQFAKHLDAVVEGVHPWSASFMNSREIPRADLDTFRNAKMMRMVENTDKCTPLSEILPIVRKYGIYKPA